MTKKFSEFWSYAEFILANNKQQVLLFLKEDWWCNRVEMDGEESEVVEEHSAWKGDEHETNMWRLRREEDSWVGNRTEPDTNMLALSQTWPGSRAGSGTEIIVQSCCEYQWYRRVPKKPCILADFSLWRDSFLMYTWTWCTDELVSILCNISFPSWSMFVVLRLIQSAFQTNLRHWSWKINRSWKTQERKETFRSLLKSRILQCVQWQVSNNVININDRYAWLILNWEMIITLPVSWGGFGTCELSICLFTNETNQRRVLVSREQKNEGTSASGLVTRCRF